MPIYEYRCNACSKTFEKFQKINDNPVNKCKDCGGKVERLISATSFSLKGGGWYKDGYSSKTGKSGAEKETKKETKNETKKNKTSNKDKK